MNIYVSNISFRASEDQLAELFAQHGEVASAKIIKDRDSGRSKGFGFVEMPNDDAAKAAISALNGYNLADRALVVNEARPQEDRNSGGGGGFKKRW